MSKFLATSMLLRFQILDDAVAKNDKTLLKKRKKEIEQATQSAKRELAPLLKAKNKRTVNDYLAFQKELGTIYLEATRRWNQFLKLMKKAELSSTQMDELRNRLVPFYLQHLTVYALNWDLVGAHPSTFPSERKGVFRPIRQLFQKTQAEARGVLTETQMKTFENAMRETTRLTTPIIITQPTFASRVYLSPNVTTPSMMMHP
ncbi:hypothetical protein [Pelagicoccus mobilis]|uniref:Uncharacterized protein n=1 Tax=Pelagicoccus mobilis TaxID=415221 RepID=A0A934VKS0_9BACT|nr:hypothetical protein [Pelagicoccus mobilis]MBK1876981.1 hypothetical protein [Pelagicoccus mobilis]